MTTASTTLVRPRLLGRLADPAATTVVWGPAGYGKSTLISSWIAANPETMAIRIARPDAVSAQTYWADVRATVADVESTGAVLVLDRPDAVDCSDPWKHVQEIRDDHPGLRVVAAVHDCDFFWDHAWEHGFTTPDITVIGPAELEFTVEETIELARQAGLAHLSERTLRDARRWMGGHPALTVSALNVARVFGERIEFERAYVRALLEDGHDRYVEWILQRSGLPALRDQALTVAAVGSRPSAGAAASLGVVDADEVLVGLEKVGVAFRLPGIGDPRWAFPRAVRAALLRIADREGVRPSGVAIARLARWLADNGESADALRLAAESQLWGLVVEIVSAHWAEVGITAPAVLTATLASLPDEIALSNSAFYYGRELAVSIESARPRRLRRTMTATSELGTIAVSHSPQHAVLVGTMRSVAFRWQGQHGEAVRHHRLLAEMSGRLAQDTPGEALRAGHLPLLWLYLGQSSQLHDDHDMAVTFFRLAHAGAGGRRDDVVARGATGHVALAEAVRGETREARRWIEREARYSETPWVGSTGAGVAADLARALVALDRLDLAAAADVLGKLPEDDGSEAIWMLTEYVRCQFDLLRGEPEVGLDRLPRTTARYRKWMSPRSLAESLLVSASMDLTVAAGDAVDTLSRSEHGAKVHPLVGLATARAALLSGNTAEALSRCAALTTRRGNRTRVRLEALLIDAAARLQADDAARARSAWNRAVTLSEDSGLVRPFVGLPAATLRRLSELGSPIPVPVPDWDREIFPEPVAPVTLTDRESRVLAGVARGDSVVGIASALFVSPNTVKTQLRSLYRKLDAHTRAEALDAARRRGLI